MTVLMSLALAAPAAASRTECVGVFSGVADQIVVPEGADCTLAGAHVLGNVKVEQGASLHTVSLGPNVTIIEGNVLSSDSRFVFLQFETQVFGNFLARGGDLGTVSGFDINVRIDGNATVEDNAGYTFVDAANVGKNLHIYRNTGFLEIEFNTVEGSVHIKDNVPTGMSTISNTVGQSMNVSNNSGPGPKSVVANTVAQKLICVNNDPVFTGGPNPAADAQGQCF